MFIGVARIVLQIPGARSLKDRRRVARSFKDRLRARLPVSVAEVGDAGAYQRATFGIAVVSNDSGRCREIISSAVSLGRSVGDALLADVRTEVISFGRGGHGVLEGIEALLEPEGDGS